MCEGPTNMYYSSEKGIALAFDVVRMMSKHDESVLRKVRAFEAHGLFNMPRDEEDDSDLDEEDESLTEIQMWEEELVLVKKQLNQVDWLQGEVVPKMRVWKMQQRGNCLPLCCFYRLSDHV